MTSGICHYELLGVDRNATLEQIKSARKKHALSLHPDKNPFGSNLMKRINAAYEVLSDDAKRMRYDRELRVRTADRQQASSPEYDLIINRLERQLRDSNSRNRALRDQLDDSIGELASLRLSSKSLTKKLKQAEEKRRQLEKRVGYFESENGGLQDSLNDAQCENEELLDQLNEQKDIYDDLLGEKENVDRALRDEKRRHGDALKREKQRANEELERVKKSMLERSTCYRCDGHGGEDCICEGRGSLQGRWTKCHNCNGAGAFASLVDNLRIECKPCSSRGAREGCMRVPCFKCKGGSIFNCSVCYQGTIKGFGLKPCPFCRGTGCENCLEKGHVSCHYTCGNSCSGHKAGRVQKPTTPSSLQRKVAEMHSNDTDWRAEFIASATSSYIYYS